MSDRNAFGLAGNFKLTSPLVERGEGDALPDIISTQSWEKCNDTVVLRVSPLTIAMPQQQWAYGLLLPFDHRALPSSDEDIIRRQILAADPVVAAGQSSELSRTGGMTVTLRRRYILDAPLGVRGRNSDNTTPQIDHTDLPAAAPCPKSLPQLSVVAVSRNDDHGGDLRGRMQHFVNGFIAQCRKHRLNAELILVEWNPPIERPPLENSIEWPADFGPASVRIITVPPELHASQPHASALALFQMLGKNVGIRRARGRYVLATNIDILFDDAGFQFRPQDSICHFASLCLRATFMNGISGGAPAQNVANH
jgi:hypothetical protein